MLRKKHLLAALMLGMSSVSLAANLCEDKQLNKVMSVCARLTNDFKIKQNSQRWLEFQTLVKQTEKCPDRAYDEGLSGVGEEALAWDWDGFIQYATSPQADPHVIRAMIKFSLTVMTGEEHITKIQENATSKCPATLARYCNAIKAFDPLATD